MEKMKAMQLMSALSQPTRWAVYKLLVAALPAGMAASDIADAVKMSRTAMSPHFAILTAAGLLLSEKTGRTVIYRATTTPVEELSEFLATAVERGRIS
jgi:ArsR family transcriptional regulator